MGLQECSHLPTAFLNLVLVMKKKTAAVSPAPPAYEKILIKGRMPGGRLLNPRHVL
ncbi:hypothetical protein [Schaedlerella arabinosiphila]|uniref:hypothetical protein n=1 Tax=Schaedlerella arabinosiphila TaxID=2044587 RepID=UPI002557E563|nr:hypothetical protein [Schaedlerella arabinosiphila]